MFTKIGKRKYFKKTFQNSISKSNGLFLYRIETLWWFLFSYPSCVDFLEESKNHLLHLKNPERCFIWFSMLSSFYRAHSQVQSGDISLLWSNNPIMYLCRKYTYKWIRCDLPETVQREENQKSPFYTIGITLETLRNKISTYSLKVHPFLPFQLLKFFLQLAPGSTNIWQLYLTYHLESLYELQFVRSCILLW